MNKLSRLRRSRDIWKSKATERAEQLREFRKTKARYQKRLEGLQSRIATLEDPLSQKRKARLGATLT